MKQEYAEYLLNKVRDDYNRIADDFSSKRSSPPKVAEGKSLADFVLPGERILDLGCGNGRLFELLKDKAIEYVGVDNSEKLIDEARRKYPQALFQAANALNLPFPDNYFDKIYALAILHHIPSKALRLQFLQEARRALKPSGTLFLTVWYIWREKKFLKAVLKYSFLKIIGKCKLDFKDVFLPWKDSAGKTLAERYYHGFTISELAKLAKQAELKVKECGLWTHPSSHYNICLKAEKQ